jgi:TRAP-type C4-dicarboxylate transport system substrate-binding protein
MVNEKFKDHINIDILGGPEVTPPFQLHEAVKKGVIDMCLTGPSYYPSLVWESQSAIYTHKDSKEIYQTEFHEIMKRLHEKAGLIYFGSVNHLQGFHLFSNVKFGKVSDFSSKKIRVFPAMIPLIKGLKAVPINLPMGDIYTAMERGTVDGFIMTHFGFVEDFSWHEVTKYVLDYEIYSAATSVLINPKKWNKLPIGIRSAIWDYKNNTIDVAIAKFYKKVSKSKWDLMINKGVKPFKFSSVVDKDSFFKIAYDSPWDNIASKSPDLGPKLKNMLIK